MAKSRSFFIEWAPSAPFCTRLRAAGRGGSRVAMPTLGALVRIGSEEDATMRACLRPRTPERSTTCDEACSFREDPRHGVAHPPTHRSELSGADDDFARSGLQ